MKNRFFSVVVLALGLFLLLNPRKADAADYYVAPTGNDSNSGSLDLPYKTIQKAVTAASPGTNIYIRAGTYAGTVNIRASGSDSSPITLTSYQSEAVTIDGGAEPAIRAFGPAANWRIQNVTLKGSGRYTVMIGWWGESPTSHWYVAGNTIYGSTFTIGSYHTFESNTVDGTGYTATQGDAGLSDADTSHHNSFLNNTVKNFTSTDARGIWTQGKTHHNLIEGNRVSNIKATSGIGQCIDLDGASNVEWQHIVRNNIIDGCNYVGIQLENVFDSTIENNSIANSGSAGIIVISYDSKVGCKTGGDNNQYGDTNGDNNCQGDNTQNIFRQNVITTSTSWGWGYGGIINWYAGGVQILGNSIYAKQGSGNAGINFQGTFVQTKNATIKNNIIFQGDGPSICALDFNSFSTDSNNLLYRSNNNGVYATGASCETTQSLTSYQQATSKGQSSIQANPQFISLSPINLHLNSSSPAIDKGVSISTSVDAEGKLRPSGSQVDMGAYEYASSEVTPTIVPTVAPTVAPTAIPTTTPKPSSTPSTTPTPSPKPTVTPVPTPKAYICDIDNNKVVNDADYMIWKTNFLLHLTSPLPKNGDCNQDGRIDGIDYVLWVIHSEISPW